MKSTNRMLKLLAIATVALLAMLLAPMVVGADAGAAINGVGLEDTYPWREPVAIGPSGVGLKAATEAMWPGAYHYYSELTFTTVQTATAVLFDLQVREFPTSPSVPAQGYCAQVGSLATKDIWLPYCQQTSAAVAYVLANYFPSTSQPAALSPTGKVAAVQAAIWHYTDGLDLANSGSTPPEVYAAYLAILADANANAGGTIQPSDLDLSPDLERNDLNDSTSHTVTARLTDGWGNGVPGETVRFQVTRNSVVVEDELAVTDALGNATLTYTYTGPLVGDIVTDTIYATVDYHHESGLRFCLPDTQDYVLADPVDIPLEDICYKEWVQCRDYTTVEVDWDVDCVEEQTSFTYLVSGADEDGPPMLTWSIGLCNLEDTGHDVVQVLVADAGDCANPSPGAWAPEFFLVMDPANPANPIPGQWSVTIPANIGANQCKYFKIVIDGLWELGTVPWAGVISTVCDASGSIQGPSCEPYEKPDCTISAPTYVCDGATGNVASVAAGYVTYTWQISGGTITSGWGTPSITFDATPGAGLISLQVTVGDIEGCENVCYKLITPSPLPEVIVPDEEVCVGEPVTLTATMIDTGECDEPQITYMWEYQDIGGQWYVIPGATGATYSPDSSVVGSFMYRVTACCGECCDMDEAMVTVHPYPEITLVGDEVCLDEPVMLTVVVDDPGDCDRAELTYQWYVMNGQTRILLQGETGASLSVDTSVPGTTTYVVVVCCADCCVEAEADVIVHPYPEVSLEPLEVCEDEEDGLTAIISSYGDCDPGAVVITWYKKNAAGAWELIPGENGETLSVDTSEVGVYEYRVRVCCGDCCDEAETTVTVLPLPVVVLYGDELCLGEEATLTANVTDTGDCEPNEMTYTWYAWNSATSQWDLIPGETGATYSYTPTAAGTFDFKVVACCDECCDEDTAQVIVDPLPEFTLEGDEVCIGGTATVTSNITSYGDCEPGQVAISWYFSNTTTLQWDLLPNETGESLSVTPAAEGSYHYKMVICCEECCAEAEATVEIYGEPPCWIEGDLEPCAGDTVTFYAAPGGAQYAWSVDSVLQTITTVPVFNWTATAGPHTISVVITDENNCMSECSTDVDVKRPRLIIEKWYDINEDGIRDPGEVPLGGFEFTVYDEQDNVVFSGVTDDIKGQLSVELDCGTYRIVESDKEFWVHTTPVEQIVTMDLSQEVWYVEFGNARTVSRPVSIRGKKFWDLNRNGRNDSEPIIGGFTVLIEKEDGTLVYDITTEANTTWTRPISETGVYTVREEVLPGWVQTYPTPNGGVYQFEVYEEAPGILNWKLLSAEPIDWEESFDFGNMRPMGFKWHDMNGNAWVTPGEPMLGNWRIVMKDMAFNIVHDTTTVADPMSPYFGYWFLTQPLPEGDYYVVEVMPTTGVPWIQTYPSDVGYLIHLYEDGSYDVLSAPQPWMDGLSFGNYTGGGPNCPLCVEYVVFQSDRDGGNYNVFTMTLDGNGVGQLTDDPGADISPAWDHTGGFITWATNRDGNYEIYLMNRDGSNKQNITNMPGSMDIQPNMECEWITFQTDRDGNWEIYKVSPQDTTNQIRLTDNPAVDGAPYWSPDGSLIAFQSDRDGNYEIYVMSGEGEEYGLQRITDDPSVDRNPAWLITEAEAAAIRAGQPDAYEPWIVFESDRGHTGQFDLYKINLDTGELIQLTDDPSGDMDPAGMPYCEWIVFESSRDGRLIDVWRMELDGSDQQNITLGEGGPNYWFDAIDQMSFWFGWVDPGEETFYANVPLIIQ